MWFHSKALAHFLQIKVWMGDPTVHKFPTIVPPTPIDLQGSTTMKLKNLKRHKIEFTFFHSLGEKFPFSVLW